MKIIKKFFLVIILIFVSISCSKKEVFFYTEGQESTTATVIHNEEKVEKIVFTYDTAIHKYELKDKLDDLIKGITENGITKKAIVKKNNTVKLEKTINFIDKNIKKSVEWNEIQNFEKYSMAENKLKQLGFNKK